MPQTPTTQKKSCAKVGTPTTCPPAPPCVPERSKKRVITPTEAQLRNSRLLALPHLMTTGSSSRDTILRIGKAHQDEIVQHNETRQRLQCHVSARIVAERELWQCKVELAKCATQNCRYQEMLQKRMEKSADLHIAVGQLAHERRINVALHAQLQSCRAYKLIEKAAMKLNMEMAKDRQIEVLKRKLERIKTVYQELAIAAAPEEPEASCPKRYGPWDAPRFPTEAAESDSTSEQMDIEIDAEEGVKLIGTLLND